MSLDQVFRQKRFPLVTAKILKCVEIHIKTYISGNIYCSSYVEIFVLSSKNLRVLKEAVKIRRANKKDCTSTGLKVPPTELSGQGWWQVMQKYYLNDVYFYVSIV